MVIDRDTVITRITEAFGDNAYPGDHFLQGSVEGCEPYEEVEPFQGKTAWQEIDPAFLDHHGGALSFFSEAGFRFYLPAFLIADARGQLEHADPLFHLTHGFYDFTVTIEKPQRTFVISSGKSRPVNPRRYGAMTAFDYACYRLSVFTREEASAIVAYLLLKRMESADYDAERIDAALDLFWHARVQSAPTAESLTAHLAEEMAYYEAIRGDVSIDDQQGGGNCACP